MSDRRMGGCLCGAVRYEATTSGSFASCFCKMCQRWSAGAYFGTSTTEFEITQGEDELRTYESSDWAVRRFCGTCGSNIYYHAPKFGGPSVALGTLDDTSGLENAIHYFVDLHPEGLATGDAPKSMTSEEIAKAFGG